MHPIFLRAVFSILFVGTPALAEQSEPAKTSRTAYIKIINCCETSLPHRWKAGVDVTAGEKSLVQDLRIGESTPYLPVAPNLQREWKVSRHHAEESPTRISPRCSPGSYYTLWISGMISAETTEITTHLIQDHPQPLELIPPDRARVTFYNAIRSFPISIGSENFPAHPITAAEFCVFEPKPGKALFSLEFQNEARETTRLPIFLRVMPGESYSAFLYVSGERLDRPRVRIVRPTMERQEIEAVESEFAATP